MDSQLVWRLALQCSDEGVRQEVVERLTDSEAQRLEVLGFLAAPTAPSSDEEYERLELLGSGAHGRVYRARHKRFGRISALKVVDAASPESAERLMLEAERVGRLASAPNIVRVLDAGILDDGMPFIEMELCADQALDAGPDAIRIGTSLRQLVAGIGPLAPPEAAQVLGKVCYAVHAAHLAGIVHGDIKPENVLITPIHRRPMLADFGLASTMAAASGALGARVGTIAYMAPEQYRGDGSHPTQASDIYTLGGTLYFALCGRAPHPSRTLDGRGPSGAAISSLPPSLPRDLRRIVERAMSDEPGRRYSTALEMAQALDAFTHQMPQASAPLVDVIRLQLLRNRGPLVLATVLALLLAGVGVTGWRLRWTEHDLHQAEERLGEAKAEREAIMQQLRVEEARLQEAASPVLRRLAELDAMSTSLKQPLANAVADLKLAKSELWTLSESKAASLQRAAADISAETALKAAALQRVAELNKEVDGARQRSEEVQRDATETTTRLRAELAAALKQVTWLSEESQTLTKRLGVAEASAAECKGRLEGAEGERTALRSRLEELWSQCMQQSSARPESPQVAPTSKAGAP